MNVGKKGKTKSEKDATIQKLLAEMRALEGKADTELAESHQGCLLDSGGSLDIYSACMRPKVRDLKKKYNL